MTNTHMERCSISFSSLQSLSRVRLFATPWTAARQASLSITNSRSSLRLTSIESAMPIQPSHPLSSPSPPAPNPSQHQSFPMSQLFAWGGQSTGVSALASIPPKNTNPTINCIHEGSRLHTPHENVMHDHLILHDGELYNYFIIYHTVLIIGIKLKRESVSCSVMSDSLWPHGL